MKKILEIRHLFQRNNLKIPNATSLTIVGSYKIVAMNTTKNDLNYSEVKKMAFTYKLIAAFLTTFCVVQSQVTQLSFTPNVGLTQPNSELHTVVKLSTSALQTECANYCAHRGALFRDNECGSFFVTNSTNCNMVPINYKDITEESDDPTIIYYIKK